MSTLNKKLADREPIPAPKCEKECCLTDNKEKQTIKTVKIKIDGVEFDVPYGVTILDAAKKADINIPTLCHHKDLCVAGSCRICVVEIENMRTLQAACSYSITSPVNIITSSPKIRRTRRNILELLLAKHYGECYTCRKSDGCELRQLAADYGVDSQKYGHITKPLFNIDSSSQSIRRDLNKCILCGRCVRACTEMQDVGVLGILNRSNKTKITTFKDDLIANGNCINCGQCVNRCPTGALTEKDDTDAVWNAIDDPTKHVIIQTAPAPRAGIGECFGLEAGHSLTFEMNTGLRKIGFDKVFDTTFSADLTIIEEGTELLLRLYQVLAEKNSKISLPQFTSCSPGWVKFIEHFYPEFLANLSSAKSPQQMFGAIIKTYYAEVNKIDPKNIVSVALMPCTAKKFECSRPEMRASGFQDVDYGITTRELAQMFHEMSIDLPRLPKSQFDNPFGTQTGSGLIFGATGGVMESALRTVLDLVTGVKTEKIFAAANIIPVRGFGGIRYAEIPITKVGKVPALLQGLFKDWEWLKGVVLKVAVCHGTKHARKVMEDIKAGGQFSNCHFIEFMACPGGCLGGGGQPIPTSSEIRAQRAKAIYADDMLTQTRKSYENPAVIDIYRNFLGGPASRKAHQLLHTHYVARGKELS